MLSSILALKDTDLLSSSDFLKGKTATAKEQIQNSMKKAQSLLKFEEAAILRDRLDKIKLNQKGLK